MKTSHPESPHRPSRTFSLAFVHSSLLICGFVALSILISGVVGFKLQDAVSDTQQANVHASFTTLKALLKTYLDDRKTQLEDHATFPILIQAVMQPEANPDQVEDFMAELRVLGEKPHLVLTDFLGQPIHATLDHSSFTYTDAPWLMELMQGIKTHYIGFKVHEGSYFWEIAVPVRFNGNPEGVLVSEIPIGPTYQLKGLDETLENAKLQLLDDDSLITTWGNIETNEGSSTEQSDAWGLTLKYTVLDGNTFEAIITLLQPILVMSLFVTSFCALVGIAVGQKFLITPLEELKTHSSDILNEKTVGLLPENQKIYELQQLATHFNVVQRQAWERKVEIMDMNRSLEARIDARTVALRQNMDELHRSNQELDDFAHIAAHDLKEPLRGIFNYSTILLEDYGSKLDAEAQSKCEALCRLSQRMAGLIDSLHYFSRAGRTELAKGPTDLQHVLDRILESIDIRIKECGVNILIPRSLPMVTCDPVRTGEIFRNLIINAMKYNDKDQKWIEIGYIEKDDEVTVTDNRANMPPVLYVRDNGIGIREKHVPNIFRIFKRLHGRDKFGGGTGAGLTITKKIVERHGGSVWVESTYGEGTTFYFTLAAKNEIETTLVENVESLEIVMH